MSDSYRETIFQCMGVVACKEYADCEGIEKARLEIITRDATIKEQAEEMNRLESKARCALDAFAERGERFRRCLELSKQQEATIKEQLTQLEDQQATMGRLHKLLDDREDTIKEAVGLLHDVSIRGSASEHDVYFIETGLQEMIKDFLSKHDTKGKEEQLSGKQSNIDQSDVERYKESEEMKG